MASLLSLPSLVRAQFEAARASGALIFYETQVCLINCYGFPFQLRFSPSLANKPKSESKSEKSKDDRQEKKAFDPFEKPSEKLLVTEWKAHNIVLNKYPVIPNHFILATKEFKNQADLLELTDFAAISECLKAYKENGEELFGFFNSGQHSGASQAHRHVQFLPVQGMRSGLANGEVWNVLADNCGHSKGVEAEELYQNYMIIYAQARREWDKYKKETGDGMSYNLAITNRAMVICPRLAEGTKIKNFDGQHIGPVALNGTLIGGTLLVKSEEEWNTMRRDEAQLKNILESIGLPQKRSNEDT